MKPLVDVMYEIVDESPSHLYVFSGEESEVMRVYINKLSELGYPLVQEETVSDAVKKCSASSFFSSHKCYLVYDDVEFSKKQSEWDKVSELLTKTDNIVVVKYTKLDKRSKLYNSDYSTVFDKLSDDLLVKYVINRFPTISESVAYELVSVCENDYGRLLLEEDKIECYLNSHSDANTIDSSYDELMKQGVIYKPIGDITFDFIDSVVYGDMEKSYEQLHQIKLNADSTLGILSLLYSNFKSMLLVQGLGRDKANAERRTGLSAWQVRNALKNIGGYKTIELRNILQYITDVEEAIKLGMIEESIALDYLIVKIMG